ncbi:MAG: hypothetical protein ACLT46_17165 [Hungatella sp.]
MDSVLEVVLAVNSKKVSLMKKEETEMCEVLRELMADEEIMELTEISGKELEILKDQMSVKGHRS